MTQARVTLRTPDDADGKLAEIYQRIIDGVGSIPAMYQTLGHSPDVLEGWIGFGWGLRSGVAVDSALVEMAILRVAQLTGSEYVWRSHWKMAQKAGADDTKLSALKRWRDSDLFTDTEQTVLAIADALVTEVSISEEDWSRAAEKFDERQRVELVMTIAWYCCVARVARGLAVPLEKHHQRVPGLEDFQ